MWMSVVCVHGAYCVQVPLETRRGLQLPWSWSDSSSCERTDGMCWDLNYNSLEEPRTFFLNVLNRMFEVVNKYTVITHIVINP